MNFVIVFSITISKHLTQGAYNPQEQPPRDVLKKRGSENMQQIYRRTSMPKCDFIKVAKQLS